MSERAEAMTSRLLLLACVLCPFPSTGQPAKPGKAAGPYPRIRLADQHSGPYLPDESERLLRQASFVTGPGIGEDGALPEVVAAFRALLVTKDGAERFERLFQGAAVGGKIYALCGLFSLRPAVFPARLAALWDGNPDTTIFTQFGCMGDEAKVRDVLGARTPGRGSSEDQVASGDLCRSLSAVAHRVSFRK